MVFSESAEAVLWQAGCAPGSLTGVNLLEGTEYHLLSDFLQGFVVPAGAYKGSCFPDCTQRSELGSAPVRACE